MKEQSLDEALRELEPTVKHLARRISSEEDGDVLFRQEDVEQDMRLELCLKFDKWDPSRAPQMAYLRGVLKYKLLMLRRRALDMNKRMPSSLSDMEAENGELTATPESLLGEYDYGAALGKEEFARKLAAAPLKREDRLFLASLCETGSIKKTCELLGMNRSSASTRRIRRIRKVLEANGISELGEFF